MATVHQPSRYASRHEPKLMLIPAGWFLMGSEAGQDNERPVHRVWVDAFQLATCQVTNAEYGRFLHTTGTQTPPPCGRSQFQSSPSSP